MKKKSDIKKKKNTRGTTKNSISDIYHIYQAHLEQMYSKRVFEKLSVEFPAYQTKTMCKARKHPELRLG